MHLDVLQELLSIIIVNLVLSADNAVVIAMAARRLSDENRTKAIFWGGAGAIILRVFFTAAAALLLDIPLLQAVGGILLVLIAFQLVSPESESTEAPVKAPGSLAQAIQTIVLADFVMSLDNIIAVGGAAQGNLGLLLFGLIVSIALILVGSNLVSKLLQQFPWLLLIGVLVLVHAAVNMFLHDAYVEDLLNHTAPGWLVVVIALIVTLVLVGAVQRLRGGIAGFGGDAEPHVNDTSRA